MSEATHEELKLGQLMLKLNSFAIDLRLNLSHSCNE